jgi:hypothetical protein
VEARRRVGSALLAALAIGSGARIASGAEPQGPSFPPPEEDTGTPRPPPPDDRTAHLYLAPSFGMIGGTGAFGPNTPTSNLAGLGYSIGAILGIGIGRYATVQVLGERSAFGAPANCNTGGCSGTSYAIGLGFTYHLTQALAFDPWASYGVAYRTSTFLVSQASPATVDGHFCQQGELCAETYKGLDVVRLAFGGDFYPTPWLGFGPFIEMDIGTNLHRPVSSPPIALPPNVFDGPRTYAFFQLGVRIAFDPMRARYQRRTQGATRSVDRENTRTPPAASARGTGAVGSF